jgi:4-amino-4-deoxy-L-arabinose transferase-like glycosyltransferase
MKKHTRFVWPVLALLFALGVLLRVGYVAVTPLDQRGHDTYSHTDYIHYVTDNLRMPPAEEGWEYHQPPLYYFLMATWSIPMLASGHNWDQIHRQLQWISVLLSLITLEVGFLIGRQLFPKPNERPALYLFAFLLATFPGLLYFASRVSNDALYLLFLFLILHVFLRWWQEGKTWQWYAMAALIGVGLLIKVSFVLCIPIVLLCLCVQKKWHMQKIISNSLQLMVILGVLAGWLLIWRMLEADTSRFLAMGNVANHLDPRVVLQNNVLNYLQFNPLRMLDIPYNSAYIDAGGRLYYWEYFFKSFYLGEWDFGLPYLFTVRWMVFLAFSIVPLSLYGIYVEWKTKSRVWLPLVVVLFVFQAASITYRILHTCACNQDYRFVPIIILPVLYFTVRGTNALPSASRFVVRVILVLSGLSCVVFFGQLIVGLQ